ncbi:hypothetical protein BC826DRAFT_1019510 [Russula brevipes]|nr:hypothetical protein BC826DRAFT_1019510 [Russula brevipes]
MHSLWTVVVVGRSLLLSHGRSWPMALQYLDTMLVGVSGASCKSTPKQSRMMVHKQFTLTLPMIWNSSGHPRKDLATEIEVKSADNHRGAE